MPNGRKMLQNVDHHLTENYSVVQLEHIPDP